MIALVGLLLIASASWLAFTFGRVTADRKININHRRFAMLGIGLQHKDDMVPFLSSEERKKLDGLVRDYAQFDEAPDDGRTNIWTLITILVVAFALMACGSGPSLGEGRVVAKEYDDADDTYIPGYTIQGSQSCTGGYNGSPRICTQSPDIHIPARWDHEEERFLLKLEAPNPDDPDKTLTDTASVPEDFFEDVRVGQWVNVDTLEVIER